MNEIERLYELNGLKDCVLNNTEDLLKVHGINFTEVDGYNTLDDINKVAYKKFIIRFFNTWGLETRANIIPKGIYFVEDVTFLIKDKEADDDDTFISTGGEIVSISKDDERKTLKSWNDPDYKGIKHTDKEVEKYLRFVYSIEGKSEWLHVIKNGDEWY